MMMKSEYRPNVVPIRVNGVREIWKRYKDTNYYVSTEGRFVCTYPSEHLVEPKYKKCIKSYQLKIGNKFHQATRLVWETFNGDIPKGYCVMNKHGYKTIWDIYSLELVPIGKVFSESAKRRAKRVINIDTGITYINATEAASDLFLTENYVRSICEGRIAKPCARLVYEER